MFLNLKSEITDRSPLGDFWFSPVGGRSLAGIPVSPDRALQLSAVLACVRTIAETVAILPVEFKKPGDKKQNTTHWLYKLLAKTPNRYQNGYQFREMLQGHLALRGNAYCQIIDGPRGEIRELMPMHPDRMKIQIFNDGNFNYIYKNRNGIDQTFARDEIWHLKGLAPDIYRGYNPIELSRDAIGAGLAAQMYHAQFYANDARPTSGWIKYPGKFKDKDSRKAFNAQVQEAMSGSKKGQVIVLDDNMEYNALGVTNADAQYIESRHFTVEEIARLFGVPPHRIGHLERSTNNNIAHQGQEYVTYTLLPWAERWEASIEHDLLPTADQDIEIEFNFKRLLRGDEVSRSEANRNAIYAGYLTRNEAREDDNLPPIVGLDKPILPVNYVQIDENGDPEPLAQNPPPNPDQ